MSIKCPECRRDTKLNGDSVATGAAALTLNFALNSVVEGMKADDASRGKEVSLCLSCGEAPSTWRCNDQQCATNLLCDFCCISHRRVKATAQHQTSNLANPSLAGPPAAAAAAASTNAAPAAASRVVLCKLHPDEVMGLRIYCLDHKLPICR